MDADEAEAEAEAGDIEASAALENEDSWFGGLFGDSDDDEEETTTRPTLAPLPRETQRFTRPRPTLAPLPRETRRFTRPPTTEETPAWTLPPIRSSITRDYSLPPIRSSVFGSREAILRARGGFSALSNQC